MEDSILGDAPSHRRNRGFAKGLVHLKTSDGQEIATPSDIPDYEGHWEFRIRWLDAQDGYPRTIWDVVVELTHARLLQLVLPSADAVAHGKNPRQRLEHSNTALNADLEKTGEFAGGNAGAVL